MLLLCLSLLIASVAYGHNGEFPGDRISFAQWTTYFDKLANTKGALLTDKPQYYVINLFSDKKRPALYVFTKPNHPAYPAVVIRSVKNGQLRRRGYYAGDRVAFDKWWHEFDALDKKTLTTRNSVVVSDVVCAVCTS